MQSTANFGFLSGYDARLVQLGGRAERYFHEDPVTTILILRQFAELLCKQVAARHALYRDERETFEETLRRLAFERIIPREASDVFHALRKAGNNAAHDIAGSHRDALSALKFAREVAVWFHRTYGKRPDFKPGPFINPVDEAEELRRKLAEIEQAMRQAAQDVQEQTRARQSAEERLKTEAEERAIVEQLAQEAEVQKAKYAAELRAVRPRLARQASISDVSFSRDVEFQAEPIIEDAAALHLAELQHVAEQSSKSDLLELVTRGEEASKKIDLDEAETRALIDQQLRDAGWEADTKVLRYGEGIRPAKGRNLAIAEWPTASGPADYALFCGLTLVGVVEAKRKRKNVSAAIDQSERYSVGFGGDSVFSFAGGPWGEHKVPFLFAANGRSYLKLDESYNPSVNSDLNAGT